MNEEITASMIFDAPAMLPALRWHNRMLNRLSKVGIVILSVVVVMGILASFIAPVSPTAPPPPIFITLLGPLLPFFLMLSLGWLIRFSFSRSIQSNPSAGKVITYRINDEGIKVDLGVSKTEFGWPAFLKSLITPDGVLLYPQKLAFNWLPKTAFTSEADYTRFIELCKAKTKFSQVG